MVRMVRWIAFVLALGVATPAAALDFTYGDVEARNLGDYGFTRADSFLSLDLATDQLYQMFGYVGNTNDVVRATGANFDVLSAISQTSVNTAQSTIVLDAVGASALGLNAGDIELDYIFTLVDDNAVSDGQGVGLTWDVNVRNTTAAPLSLVFYSYLDLDLDATFDNDRSVANGTRMVVTDDLTGTTFVWNASVSGADHFEVQQWPAVRTTLEGMLGSPAQDLGDSLANFGPGDFSGAYQYNFVLPANGSFLIGGGSVAVPEPSTALLTLLGLVGLSFHGRRFAR